MMSIMKLAAIVLLCLLVVPQGALAAKGVGIVWSTQTEAVTENSRHCITYGVYNPWDEDVTALLSVSSALSPVVVGEESIPTFLPAETMHDDAKEIELCFYVPKVYTDDCLVGNFLFCEQTCSEPEVRYDGEVIVMEAPSGSGGAMGSSTAMGVSAPLTLRVLCNEYPRDYTIVIVGVVVVVAAGGYYYFRKRKK
jgi:LPXTG-motif cell wall-anchored protein